MRAVSASTLSSSMRANQLLYTASPTSARRRPLTRVQHSSEISDISISRRLSTSVRTRRFVNRRRLRVFAKRKRDAAGWKARGKTQPGYGTESSGQPVADDNQSLRLGLAQAVGLPAPSVTAPRRTSSEGLVWRVHANIGWVISMMPPVSQVDAARV